MSVTSISAEKIARAGANLEITENSKYSAISVEKLVQIATATGAQITIHAANYSSISLEKFVAVGNGNVTIVV